MLVHHRRVKAQDCSFIQNRLFVTFAKFWCRWLPEFRQWEEWLWLVTRSYKSFSLCLWLAICCAIPWCIDSFYLTVLLPLYYVIHWCIFTTKLFFPLLFIVLFLGASCCQLYSSTHENSFFPPSNHYVHLIQCAVHSISFIGLPKSQIHMQLQIALSFTLVLCTLLLSIFRIVESLGMTQTLGVRIMSPMSLFLQVYKRTLH